MRLRNQRGCLRCTRRKTGPSCWEFLWRENDSDGNRTRRTAVIGTVEQFPTRDLAQVAVNGLRMSRKPESKSPTRTVDCCCRLGRPLHPH
jgi:hypothetical protein